MYLPVCMGILTAPPSRKGVKTKAPHFGSGKQLPNPGLVLVWGGGEPRVPGTVVYANSFLQHSLLGEGRS